MTTIYKGDDTNAFGKNLIRIELNGVDGLIISKVIFQCGDVQKVFVRPEFPIYIAFSSNESSQLYADSICYLQIFDEKGRRHTCQSTFTFKTKSV